MWSKGQRFSEIQSFDFDIRKFKSHQLGKKSQDLPLSDYLRIATSPPLSYLEELHLTKVDRKVDKVALKLGCEPMEVILDQDISLVDANKEDNIWKKSGNLSITLDIWKYKSRTMKQFFIFSLCMAICIRLSATDPVKRKTYFIEFDIAYPYYHHYNQVHFSKTGLGLGGAISVGHHSIPIYLEYFLQSPLIFSYRNNAVKDAYQELGLRYNLNHLTYHIPYGVDPYLGAGLMHRQSSFTQYAIDPNNSSEVLNAYAQKVFTYKLSGGVKIGNHGVTLGLHYDFLPGGLSIPNSETDALIIYNSMHVFSARVGIRLNKVPGRKIKCPHFNTKQKRTLRF